MPKYQNLNPKVLVLLLFALQAEAWADTINKKQTLEDVKVSEKGSERRRTQKEVADNYTVRRSTSATKLNLVLRRTPQTVSVITEKQIQDQNLTDIDAVLSAAPGISQNQSGVTGIGHAFYYSRGFPLRNFMLDGVLTSVSPQGGQSRGEGLNGASRFFATDSAIYERVDIIRGSTGLVSGNGDPGGTLNLVRKKPTLEPQAKISLAYGTWARKRAEVDVSTVLHQSSGLRWRMVGVAQNGKHWMRYVNKKDYTLYNILEMPIGDNTIINGGLSYAHQHLTGATPVTASSLSYSTDGLVIHERPGGRGRNSSTRWSFAKNHSLNTFVNLDHRFNDNWSITTAYNYNKMDSQIVYGFLHDYRNSPAVGLREMFRYSFGQWKPETKSHSVDISLKGQFTLWSREAEVIGGLSAYHNKILTPYYGTQYYATITHCGQPNHLGMKLAKMCSEEEFNDGWIAKPINYWVRKGIEGDIIAYNHDFYKNFTTEKQYAVHLMGRAQPVKDVMLIVGGRYNRWVTDQVFMRRQDDDTWQREDSFSLKLQQGGLSWFSGLVYDITPQWSAYTSYAQVIDPQADVAYIMDKNGEPLKEREGKTIELGIKGSLFNERLNTQLALFRVKQDNLPYAVYPWTKAPPKQTTPIENYSEPVVAGPGLKVKGAELALSGSVRPNWQINAAYTYLSHEMPDLSLEGKNNLLMFWRENGLPKHQFKLFSNWQVVDKLSLGLGMNFKSKVERYFNKAYLALHPEERGNNFGYIASSRTTFDVMAGYQITKNFRTQVNVQNLFDKTYYQSIRRDMYGAPRNITLTLQGKF